MPISTKVKGIQPQQDEMVSYIHAKLPVNVIVRLPHPRRGDSQGRETILAPSADNESRNYDTGCFFSFIHELYLTSKKQ